MKFRTVVLLTETLQPSSVWPIFFFFPLGIMLHYLQFCIYIYLVAHPYSLPYNWDRFPSEVKYSFSYVLVSLSCRVSSGDSSFSYPYRSPTKHHPNVVLSSNLYLEPWFNTVNSKNSSPHLINLETRSSHWDLQHTTPFSFPNLPYSN